ncbi:TraB/GumN family protein [Candidatus Paracaedibacter symbiosus]|uniref:TraB/GumN family protein n=1 Tax=Candidatus Paracaedibacter symbiosus TaxID=244582 RepID=UPI000509B46E|nr:TraB/GumN family protein [Candidatus Paracaedibacter symbiosus]
MNLYKIFYLSFLCFTMSCVCGSGAYGADTFLFSFERDGRKSYLVGTQHGIDPVRLPPALTSCLLERSVLVVENTDTQKPLDECSLAAMGALKKSNEPSYIEMLDRKDRTELLNYVNPFLLEKGGHIQADRLNLKGLYATYIGGHFLNGLDYWLMRSFKQSQKEIQGLETREDVSAFFEDVTFDNFEQIIKHQAGFGSPEALKIDEDYLLGVIPPEEAPEFEGEMLQRNPKWLGKIIDYHRYYSEGMVAAVGYNHLFGKSGLLNLLSHEGFILKRMSATGDFIEFKL